MSLLEESVSASCSEQALAREKFSERKASRVSERKASRA